MNLYVITWGGLGSGGSAIVWSYSKHQAYIALQDEGKAQGLARYMDCDIHQLKTESNIEQVLYLDLGDY